MKEARAKERALRAQDLSVRLSGEARNSLEDLVYATRRVVWVEGYWGVENLNYSVPSTRTVARVFHASFVLWYPLIGQDYRYARRLCICTAIFAQR